jgi:hypothetical protein
MWAVPYLDLAYTIEMRVLILKVSVKTGGICSALNKFE